LVSNLCCNNNQKRSMEIDRIKKYAMINKERRFRLTSKK
jgi:hypothetical protein